MKSCPAEAAASSTSEAISAVVNAAVGSSAMSVMMAHERDSSVQHRTWSWCRLVHSGDDADPEADESAGDERYQPDFDLHQDAISLVHSERGSPAFTFKLLPFLPDSRTRQLKSVRKACLHGKGNCQLLSLQIAVENASIILVRRREHQSCRCHGLRGPVQVDRVARTSAAVDT